MLLACSSMSERLFGNLAKRNIEVADVSYRHCRWVIPPMGVIAINQHATRLPNGAGPEPGAAAVCCADIKRNTGNAKRGF